MLVHFIHWPDRHHECWEADAEAVLQLNVPPTSRGFGVVVVVGKYRTFVMGLVQLLAVSWLLSCMFLCVLAP